MIRPKVSKTSLARAFSGGTIFTDTVRTYDLPVSQKPQAQPAAPQPAPATAPPPNRLAQRAAFICRLSNIAFLLSLCVREPAVPVRLGGVVWHPPPAPSTPMCSAIHVPIHIAVSVVLLAALLSTQLADNFRHTAAIMAVYVVAARADAFAIVLGCASVLAHPDGVCAWLVAWACPLCMLLRGVNAGGDSTMLIGVAVTAVALGLDAEAGRQPVQHTSKLAKELLAEVCVVALLARPRGVEDPKFVCSA